MLAKVLERWHNWKYIDEHNPVGWFAFWFAVFFWWWHRPRLGKCAYCHRKIWCNGDQEYYCSEGCEQHGPDLEEDEIPF